MKTFIKVTEIWVPGKDRTQLELAAGIYGELKAFEKASMLIRFSYAKGVPGAVWASGKPLVITDFVHSCFKRTAMAKQAGLSCAIGIPIFAGEFLMAVVMFLCGDDDEHAGAIELWANDPHRINELGVIDGYYGTLDYFEFISRKTSIMKGFGLPGQVWEKGLPMIMPNLDAEQTFIRGRDAMNAGITTALGILLSESAGQVYILTFLSAKATPIARQLEIWLPDRQQQRLVFKEGFSETETDLATRYATKSFGRGEGTLGQVWLTGMPRIIEQYGVTASIGTLVMPVVYQGSLRAVVVFCL